MLTLAFQGKHQQAVQGQVSPADEDMAFHSSAVFPTALSFPSTGGPTFGTDIVQMDSGQELRSIRLGAQGRYKYTVAVTQAVQEIFNLVYKFALARHGAAYGFRFLDWRDYTSHPDGVSDGSPFGSRVSIATGNGIQTIYQLSKPYQDDAEFVTVRKITRPIGGTVRVWIAGVEKTETTDFVVDVDTGRISFTTAPANGSSISVSFQFHVPVRFGESVDEWLEAVQSSYAISDFQLTLDEIRDTSEFSDLGFQAGGYHITTAAAGVHILRYANGIMQDVNATGPSVAIKLWDTAAEMFSGGPYLYLSNVGANSFALQDFAGAALATIGVGESAEIYWTGSAWRVG